MLFVIANAAYQAGLQYYDSLLPEVTSVDRSAATRARRVSALAARRSLREVLIMTCTTPGARDRFGRWDGKN